MNFEFLEQEADGDPNLQILTAHNNKPYDDDDDEDNSNEEKKKATIPMEQLRTEFKEETGKGYGNRFNTSPGHKNTQIL